MSLPRVLLVEDNLPVQHFVRAALEDLPIELHCCSSVDAALASLAEHAAALILTDLMMPVRTGFELVQVLGEQPALQGQAKLVIFSAGLNEAVRARLQQPHVWRLLSKPCSLADLLACVQEALALGQAAPGAAPQVLTQHFQGDQALYTAFRQSCLKQFPADLASGDLACARADAGALQLLAHSLKSALQMLGDTAGHDLAKQLEQAAGQGDWTKAAPLWQRLRQVLTQLR
ncbi:Hpt domain-containing response regulator [Roseateles sp. PN1]|uniref:Hpt domain-containing response regulator n=1 Tax=Roseateles sp. PN1 TaxID=3137372 RepID=UPI003139D917